MFAYECGKHKIMHTFHKKVKLQWQITQEFCILGMWNFESIIVFIWTQTCKEIFKSALEHIIALLRENNSKTLTGNI